MVEGRSIHLLGSVRSVQGDDEDLLTGRQARLVLVYLALEHDRPVSADELAQVLWPDGPTRHWEGALRGVISKVRAFLNDADGTSVDGGCGPAATIENVGHTYRFVCRPDVPVDVWHARRELAQAEALVAADRGRDAAPAAGQAVALLVPPLLAGEQAEWLDRRRAELDAMRRRAHRAASVAESASGHHAEAIALAEAAVADDAYDEEGHRGLMAAHLAAGDRAGALRVYGECRRVLADELGVSPSAQTEALHLALLADPTVADRPGLSRLTDRPFVGRELQLSVLARAWEHARTGRRQIVLLHGEPGVGKTRVALEAVKRSAPANLLFGRCSAEDRAPFEPFDEALGRHLAALDEGDLVALVEPFARELSGVVPTLAPRLGVQEVETEVESRPRTFEAVRSVLGRIAATPTILVLDDLQWADPTTLLLLRHALRMLDHARLLVIGTYRDDGEPGAALADAVTELHRLDGCHSLPVEGLDATEIADLLRANELPHPVELGEALAERTGGNPFYLVQVLTATSEDPATFDPFQVPDSVSMLVRHRVSSLSTDAGAVLAIAAVMGTDLSASSFERAVLDGGGRLEAVDELLDRHLLLDIEVGRYSFAHAIARDAVYGQLSRTHRRRLHLGAARAVEAVGGGDPEAAATIAHHYRMADDPAHAVELVDATVRAADHAMRVLAYEQAADLYAKAVGYIDRFSLVDPRTADLYVGLGAAHRRTGDFASARDALAVAVALGRAPGREAIFADAVLELVAKAGRGVAVDMADADRADLLQEAVDRLDQLDRPERDGSEETTLLVTLLGELALALLLTDQAERRRAIADRARRIAADSGHADLAVRAVVAHRLLMMRPDQAADRRAHIDALIDAPHAQVSTEQLVRLRMWCLTDSFEVGDRARVDLELAALIDAAAQLGQPYWLWLAATWQALLTYVDGDPDRADAQAVAALDLLAGAQHPEAILAYGIQLVGFRLQEGRGREVVDLLRGVAADNAHVPAMRCGLTFALAQAGAHAEARRNLEELAACDFGAIPRDASWSVSMACLAETCCELEDAATAARMLPILRPFREQFVVVTGFGGGGACWGPVSGVLGSLEACVGELAAADHEYGHALAALERFEAPLMRDRIARTRDERLGQRRRGSSTLRR